MSNKKGVRLTNGIPQRFEQQIKIWVQLAHPNILPFYGLCTQLTQNVSIVRRAASTLSHVSNTSVQVSEWQEFGNVRKFVEDNPYTDKIKLVCGSVLFTYEAAAYLDHLQMRGASDGLTYLHSHGIVHGNGTPGAR